MKCQSRDALRASILFILTAAAQSAALAQEAPRADTIALEEVVVTGSLIKGAREDAAVAVEVFTAEELEAQGAPNIIEFTRSLTSSTEALGEPNVDLAGTAAGSVTVNLRGLGAARTLTLLNGHRTSGDVSFIPTNAIGRVEVLEDGAGVTYGAGAVGGVINFVTRRNFEGLELSGQHKFIQGSDGESDIGFVWGYGSGGNNILVSAQYVHQGRLNFTEREYGTSSFELNPTQYLAFSSQPASYYVPTGIGTRVNDYTPASCVAVGGVQPNGTQECYYYYTPLFNFVDETENIRVFASGDFHVSDDMRGRFELGYSRTDVPETWAAPTIPPDPTRRGAAGALGVCAFSAFLCEFQIPISVNGVQNPFVGEFYARNLPGTPVPATGSIYTGVFWEPFALNGNPLYQGGARHESRLTDRWGFSASVEGDFTSWLKGVSYNYGVSGGMTRTKLTRRDIVVSRLQNALRGYGGPGCSAIDNTPTDYTTAATYDATAGIQSATAPGTNGCQWFNPFASSFSHSAVNGGANPSYGGASFENSRELLKWLQPDVTSETRSLDINVDLLFSGNLPAAIALPGGDISWALGGQYRSVSDRGSSLAEREIFDIATQPCPYAGQTPGQRGCSSGAPGPFWATGRFQATKSLQEVQSVFAELRLPIIDSIDAQLAVRHEDYGGFDGTVYKGAVKWQALDWLAFRGSYSTNYAAPPSNITDTTQTPGTAYISRFTTFFPTLNSNVPGTGPEKAVVKNFGVLFNGEGFSEGSRFGATLDYFDFDIDDQIVSTSVTTVLNNIAPAGNNFNAAVNCGAGLISFAVLNAPCGPGTTLNNVSQILVYQTNGPGIRTSGVELGLDYSQPALAGELAVGAKATRVTKYEVEGYSVNGVAFDTGGNRLGYANLERSGDFSSKLRGNAYGNYRFGDHNFRVQVNYTKGVIDDRGRPNSYPYSTYGIEPHDYYDIDVHYRMQLPWFDDTGVRLSALNVTDRDPMRAQARNGYYTGVGNARGRQIEVAVNAKF
jgi:outer membrane receptor protein involved in Fe transport